MLLQEYVKTPVADFYRWHWGGREVNKSFYNRTAGRSQAWVQSIWSHGLGSTSSWLMSQHYRNLSVLG